MADHLTSQGDVYLRTDPERVVSLTDRDRGAHVEIIDPTGDQRMLVPTVVRVNGVDVGLLAEGGITVDAGSIESATQVTLVLLASSVEIKALDERGAEEAREAVEVAQRAHGESALRLHEAQLALRAAEGKV